MDVEPTDEVGHLRLALEHRSTIGIALGIIIERFGMTQDQAFAYRSRVANDTETKLYEVAR